MNIVVANAALGYFETLYDLNRNLIMCCGLDVINNSGQYEKPISEIIQDIPRLIPYSFNKRLEKYEIRKEGLLEFANEIPSLEDDYKDLLQKNYKFLSDVKSVRNKLEHSMHGVRLDSSGSSSGQDLFELTYKVEANEITLHGEQFVDCIKQLNTIFSKIQRLISEYAVNNDKQYDLYYQRLLRYDYSKFNPIYDSCLLKNIGQALFPF